VEADEEGLMPVAGVDYPATWPAFQSWFPDEAACVRFLEKLRWPNGFVCPVCDGGDAWRTKEGLWLCASCRRKTSVTSGTIFHRSRLPLTSWFAAAWLVTSQKNGVSALGLKRVLGLGSYQTAWAWMHKLRRAMVRPDREHLSGLVEVDESYVGATDRGLDGRRVDSKAIVVIAVELLQPRGFGRVRLARVPEASQRELLGFVHRVVTPGSIVRTDGWNVYRRLAQEGYHHDPVSIAGTGDLAHVAMPGVHRVSSLLKRWLAGTLHYAVSLDHLDYYLDEFTFRFNRRRSNARGLLFYRLLQQAVTTDPHPYRHLLAPRATTTSGG
jgi:transposase-like protein